jgi:hypothetical protein
LQVSLEIHKTTPDHDVSDKQNKQKNQGELKMEEGSATQIAIIILPCLSTAEPIHLLEPFHL